MRANKETLREIALLFLRLGLTAFGGPAAHIAMLEDEVVTRRGWMERQHFLDLIGATNLIPGPNSTEMVMHVGYERGGWLGMLTAGTMFIGPAVLITGFFAWLYVQYGSVPEAAPLLLGIKPAVLAVILAAVWKLGKKAVKGWAHGVIGAAVLAALFAGVNHLSALLAGGLLGALWLYWLGSGTTVSKKQAIVLPLLPKQGLWPAVGSALASVAAVASEISLWKLALFFLKIGAVLYGSGYVLVAFLQNELVDQLGWLTEAQLLDAIAVGQFTPGPVLSTATFIGFILAGVPGAIVATVGIFLPSFIFVSLLNPLIPRLRQMAWAAYFLDAVNVAAVALMAAVAVQLGQEILLQWPAWLILFSAAFGAIYGKLNSGWIVLGGAAAGLLFYSF